MILNLDNWKKKDYDSFINYLYSLQDKKYKEFHGKLIKSDNIIGVRTPLLKNIAKEISKGNYKDFFELNKCDLYEEKVIYGLIIGYIKEPFEEVIKYLNSFINCIDNWAVCDIVCANLKIFKKNSDNGILYIEKYLFDNNIWINRVGIVLLLDFYINDNYIDYIIDIIPKIKSNDYYVSMAIAWLVSICYIKQKDKTLPLLLEKKLDCWIHNKSIQKIIESTRISTNEKNVLRKLKVN